jgi:hypothetical protein
MSSVENPFQPPSPEQEIRDSKLELFDRLFRYGTIEKILPDQLPPDVLQYFDGMNRRFVDPEDPPQVFNGFYKITHTDNSDLVTYVADKDMLYTDFDKTPKGFERNVFLYEMKGAEKTGHAELRYRPKAKIGDAFKDKPFIGYNGTEKDFLHQGLARKRIFAMGAYSEMEWGLPLYSGDQNKMADGVWQSLVSDGLAEEVPNYTKVRKRYKLLLTGQKSSV